MTDLERPALERIRSNIEEHGHHVYMILGGEHPQFAYSIGLGPTLGAELLLAGGTYYALQQAKAIINAIARIGPLRDGANIQTDHGDFALRQVHESWSDELLLGALDYYDAAHVAALQVVPQSDRRTIDVPDCGRPFDPALEPIWQCLTQSWPFSFCGESRAVTNLRALQGEPITEGLRRSEHTWELFADADPDVPQEGVITVPLATLLMFDASLRPFAGLNVGAGLMRETGGEWRSRVRR